MKLKRLTQVPQLDEFSGQISVRSLGKPQSLPRPFFPGSTPLYVGAALTGGFGVSGDGVDQDGVVTSAGQGVFAPPVAIRADQLFYRGVRLPMLKFNRNPLLG